MDLGDRIIYYLGKLTQMMHPVLSPFEAKMLLKYARSEIVGYPPIFIIGAPRTGSTILYQTITKYCDVSYISNFDCYFFKDILIGVRLSKELFKYSVHDSLSSKYGATKGLKSPCEAGALWYRWFPSDRHFVNDSDLEENQLMEMKEVINGVIRIKGRPIIFKNMNCGQRLQVLAKVFPDALFIYITRDPLYTAQSILMVREQIFGNRKAWWSIMPKEYDQLLSLSPTEQVVAQIYFIQKQIEHDLNNLFPDSYYHLEYEKLCQYPANIIEEIRKYAAKRGVPIEIRDNYNVDHFIPNNRQNIDDNTFRDLKIMVNKYFG